MVVCKYFQQGNCRFGSSCRYEHPQDGGKSQWGDYRSSNRYDALNYDTGNRSSDFRGRSSYGYSSPDYRGSYGNYRNEGGYGDSTSDNRGSHGNGSYDDRYNAYQPRQYDSRYSIRRGDQRAKDVSSSSTPTLTSTSTVASTDLPLTNDQIFNVISEEVDIWETSKMWPYSSYGYCREVKSLPDLDDWSFEEVRFTAYQASFNSDPGPYLLWISQLNTEYQSKRSELKRPNASTRIALIKFFDETRHLNKTANGVIATGNHFFGATSATVAFGATPAASGAFGAAPPTSGGFGTFGIPLEPSVGRTFGAPSASGAFGVPLIGSSFGAPSANGTFGASSATLNILAPTAVQSPGFSFSNPTPSGIFGQVATNGAAGGFFSSVQQTAVNVFGQPATVSQSSGGFSTHNSFGADAGFFSAQKGVATVSPYVTLTGVGSQAAGSASSNMQNLCLFTPMDDLSADDKEEFKRDKFTLGHVPFCPPPQELL